MLSSKFCSQCGFATSPDDLVQVQSDMSRMIAEGQKLFGESKLDLALAVAESALAKDPESVEALALKGDCLERKGDLSGALESYEQLVTLKPDSPLDRIRLAQLRRLAATSPLDIVQNPAKKVNILAIGAACVLIASTASAIVLANKKEGTPSNQKVAAVDENSSRPFMTPAPVPTQEKDVVKPDPTKGSNPTLQPNGKLPEADQQQEPSTSVSRPNMAHVPNSKGIGANAASSDNGFVPISPNVDAIAQNNHQNSSGDPDPKVERPEKEVTKPDNGDHQPIIDIRPSSGSKENINGSGSQVKSDANEGTALIRVARQYFLAGEYDKAAKAYEKALRTGVSSASANHRLAQCYVNLNRRSDALAAYQRALSAYQRMLESGSGDRRLVESYIEECRQAIKLLQ